MAFFYFDPNRLVSAPYWQCPGCSTPDVFGVLHISSRSYDRRCKQCGYSQTYRLPRLRKRILYLDQFALSNMMKAINPKTKWAPKGRTDAFWLQLFETLHALVSLQLVVCPQSGMHEEESLVSPFFHALKQMYDLLSHGMRFRSYTAIRTLQLSNHATQWIKGKHIEPPTLDVESAVSGDLHGWQGRLIFAAKAEMNQKWIDELRRVRQRRLRGLTHLFKHWSQEKKAFDEHFQIEVSAYGRGLLGQYIERQLELHEYLQGLKEPSIEDLMPRASVDLVDAVMRAFGAAGMSQRERWPMTINYFVSPSLADVPFVRIAALLYAALSRKAASGQKQPPSQGMMSDIRMLSVLLPYCDAMFIDNQCRGLLTERPLCDRLHYETRLFSYRNRGEFMQYISEIRSNAPKGQLEKVREVYGEDWEKPFTGLYKGAGG